MLCVWDDVQTVNVITCYNVNDSNEIMFSRVMHNAGVAGRRTKTTEW